MARVITPSYILTLRLKTSNSDVSALEKYFELSRKMYNALLSESLRRFNLMKNSKEYQKARKEKTKSLSKKLFKLAEEKCDFRDYSLQKFSTSLRINEFKNIDASTVQVLATRAINSINKIRFGNAKKVHFVKYKEMTSIEGKTNRQGITYRDGFIKFRKLKIPVIVKHNDLYAQKALQDRVKYCRILRREIKGRIRFYVQLILEGTPPMKVDKETGEIKNSVGVGKVGIDIGTRTIAIASNYKVDLLELAEGLNSIENQKRILSRKLDRQRRANNPSKYNEDGTIKKDNRSKWIKSKNYIKTQSKLKDVQRKLASQRKEKHEVLANYIISLGDEIKVEEMNFKGLQARAKKTTVNEKTGKINKKKRFGKSLSNKAPSMLLEIINRKLVYEGLKLYRINTFKVKASQYNPFNDNYIKKDLNQRWNHFDNFKIQRDLMSALIIKYVIVDKTEKLDKIDREDLLNNFNEFKKLHDKEIIRIRNSKNKIISSMGI